MDNVGYRLCIAVCSRERPVMLSKLIGSYQALEIPVQLTVELLVVENDGAPRMRELVEQLADAGDRPIHYIWESRLGIPIARNRSIEAALGLGATHIAMVDDDEWFPSDWLINIWSYYRGQESSCVIQGPVLSQLPAGVPAHFREIFQRRILPTGTRLHMCMTNNVLVPLAFFAKYDLRFDESHPFAGGTDSKLFRQAHALGAVLLYCAEAPVLEEIPRQRISFRWLSRRHFRMGLTLGESVQLDDGWSLLRHLFGCLGKLVRNLFKLTLYLPLFNRRKSWRYWLKMCRVTGIMLGPFGVRVDAYRVVQGD